MEDRFRQRLWDSVNERLFETTMIGYYSDRDDEYIRMQCTGLKDSEEILVWEGDIIIGWYGEKIGHIVFKDASFWIQTPIGCFRLYEYYEQAKDTIKVNGNIYENPELK